MAGTYTAVDLPGLPFPQAVEVLDYETILAATLADLVARDPSFTALVESDPAFKILEVSAYRELLVRVRVNEAIKAVTLAYAIGADLEQIAARYDVERLLLDAGNPDAVPPIPPTFEDDASLRRRTQLAFESFSTAGPAGAYIFHSLGADADVLDAAVHSPTPGQVVVAVLSRTDTGTAPDETLDAVELALNADEVRPITDEVIVQSAEIVEYTVEATLTSYPGPDSAVVMAAAQASIENYVARSKRLGRDITISGVYAALHQEGVRAVTLVEPAASIINDWDQAPHCTGITLTYGGTGD
jgi:phage-related baseplate assembly protein